ncbi:MAG: rhodanese-related sulfurtransferase [Anaerolineae bacterium]|nr:rhodanese-related sulfurtransferase [Gloeobacterales cyanobacterium ES-bin-313]
MELNRQVVAAFYQFVSLPDYKQLREVVFRLCQEHQIKGTILLAAEGMNGTISGLRSDIDAVFNFLRSDPRLADLQHKTSFAEAPPFDRLKVRLKKEIVTIGLPEVDPLKCVGTYVPPQNWNALIAEPDVTLIDTRNNYEVSVGTFKGAQNPQLHTFREFPEYVRTHLDPNTHKRVALFCTGGIRCEKATSFLIDQGFEEVYHLEGGILKYLEDTPTSESLWEGECFVFDHRVTVDQNLAVGTHSRCRRCGDPISRHELTSSHYQPGISCPHCYRIESESC